MRSPFLLQLREKFEIFRKMWYNKMGNYSCLMQLPAAIKFDKLQLFELLKFDNGGAAHSQLRRKFDTRRNLMDVRTRENLTSGRHAKNGTKI